MVALIAILASGLMQVGPGGGMEKLVAALNDLARGASPSDALNASYVDGNGFHGVTTVRIEHGLVSVKQTRPRRPDLAFSGPLEPTEAATLARRAVDGKLWTVVPVRVRGVPDETRPEIRLGVEGAGDFAVTLWANEADTVPAFATVREQLLAIAARVSGGRVTY